MPIKQRPLRKQVISQKYEEDDGGWRSYGVSERYVMGF